ncbi:hypothetical protein K470DRAFT_177512 [Piedraia hortae CBS 480.64]|uniref:Uncharacterized protein n=1 Tax=Piedraia hortae CBS 480.64 TaxID=1314780 RepID=A0A6A7BRM6_9PEZI|nr:hypothetical protein K470DRAFT_177512 [Piedraia hortae CBS 480.64]
MFMHKPTQPALITNCNAQTLTMSSPAVNLCNWMSNDYTPCLGTFVVFRSTPKKLLKPREPADPPAMSATTSFSTYSQDRTYKETRKAITTLHFWVIKYVGENYQHIPAKGVS